MPGENRQSWFPPWMGGKPAMPGDSAHPESTRWSGYPINPRPEGCRAPRSSRQAVVSSGQTVQRGERALAVIQPEAWAAAGRRRGLGHRCSHRSRVDWATAHLLQEEITSDASRMRHGGAEGIGRVARIRPAGTVHARRLQLLEAQRRPLAPRAPGVLGQPSGPERGRHAVGFGDQQAAEDQPGRQLTLGRGP